MSLTEPARRRDGSSRSARDEALVSLPARSSSPAQELLRRGLLALLLLSIVVLLVWFDRASYRDTYDGSVGLIDAIYYATVTITTTGYGDITPVAPHARVLSAIVVTPLRVAFLVLLVGTTLEVLAHHGRRMFKDARWRKRMRNHIVVVGFGTKGRSAVETLKNNGTNPNQVVVIDSRPSAITDANLRGMPRSKVTRLGVTYCAGPRS
jgi:voltage-gated potassium channel